MFFLWLVRSLASCGILWHLVALGMSSTALNSPQQLFWQTSCLSFPPNSCEQSEINSASPGGKPLQKSLHWSCRLARNKFTGCVFSVDWLHGGICNEGMPSWWEIVSYGLCLLNTCKCTWQQEPAWRIAEHAERHVFHAFIPKVPTERETWCSHQQHFGCYVPRAIRSIRFYPWWPRQPTETEDDWWSTRGHHLDLSWHDDTIGIGSWIHLDPDPTRNLGTSRNLGFDPWSELKPVMKSLRHVVTVMSTILYHILHVIMSLASGCIAFLLQYLKWQFHNVHAHTIPFPPILQVDIYCASSIFTNLGFHFGAFGTIWHHVSTN